MAHISWSHNILFQVLETDPHHPALPLLTVVNIVKISRNYFENTVNIISNIEPGQKVNINGSKIQNQCVIMCDCMTCVIVFDLIFINIKYLPKIEYGGSSLQYPIKYTPPIYEGLKPHSIRLQESILKVHLHFSSLPPHECQMQDVKIFL